MDIKIPLDITIIFTKAQQYQCIQSWILDANLFIRTLSSFFLFHRNLQKMQTSNHDFVSPFGSISPPPSNKKKKGFLGHETMHQTRWSLSKPHPARSTSRGLRPYLPKRSKLSTQIRTSKRKVGEFSPVFLVCWCFWGISRGLKNKL